MRKAVIKEMRNNVKSSVTLVKTLMLIIVWSVSMLLIVPCGSPEGADHSLIVGKLFKAGLGLRQLQKTAFDDP